VALPEAELAHDDDHVPLSEEAENLDDHARGLISDLTELDVRRPKPRPANGRKSLVFLILLVVALVALFLFGFGVLRPGWKPAEVESTVRADTGTSVAGSGTDGPLSGTWDVYWTNSDGEENQAFTIRFVGADAGTVEFVEGAYEVMDATFEVNGDQVAFAFTRIFNQADGDWPEASTFEGTLTAAGRIVGEWTRQNWSCAADLSGKSTCRYEPDLARYPSRLVRR